MAFLFVGLVSLRSVFLYFFEIGGDLMNGTSRCWRLAGVMVALAGVLLVAQPASGGAPLFSPPDIAGLLHWHQASSVSGVGDGGTVSSWGNDATCGGYCDGVLTAPTNTGPAVMAGTSDPTYNADGVNGFGAVRFTGSATSGLALPNNPDALLDRLEYNMAIPAGISGPDPDYTMIVAAERAGLADAGNGFGTQIAGWGNFNGSAPWFQIDNNVGLQHAFGGPVNGNTFTADPIGVPNIYVLSKTSAGAPVAPENTHLSRGNLTNLVTSGFASIPSPGGPPNVQVGWNGVTGGPEWSPGDTNIAELIIYDGELTSSQVLQVGKYLEGKYGIPFIPEPSCLVLLGMGALALMGFRRRASA